MPETQQPAAPTREPTPVLTPKEQSLLLYLKKNISRPEFAVARRQEFGQVLNVIDKLVEHIRQQSLELNRQKYLNSGLHLAATGKLTKEQIEASPVLSPSQKKDLVRVAHLHAQAQH